ncbi:MAG: hypothetical protein DCC68_16335 [Planctomycetota bacterium]|nr:MAG: hypothetical protein DCC68_16335 [Planctomycetota bacterium]
MKGSMLSVAAAATLLLACARQALAEPLATDDGYRGVWYANQASGDAYRYKYSGGMATYPHQHAPIAVYCPQVEKTFFVYGGTTARVASDKQRLLHMVSCFDHRRRTLPRPRILLDKQTSDAHDNPVLAVDVAGHLWVFSPSHGTGRPSYIHRSVRPYDIAEFERVAETNFSYPQPWQLGERGFLLLHTRYGGRDVEVKARRSLAIWTSKDGRRWDAPRALAGIAQGCYQVSWTNGRRVGTAFNHHPPPLGLNGRANLYYVQTDDAGATWTTAAGEEIELPVTEAENPALVYDSVREKKLVYLKDINFDADGRPVILFLTSGGYEAGPKNDPRTWQTARWTGTTWERRVLTTSDNNYDHGSLYIEADGAWRVIAPTEDGPQRGNPGGEVVVWTSGDQGVTWKRVKQLTANSEYNHTFIRRPLNADPDFYALWADGHGREASPSRLYFTDRDGTRVWRLPEKMNEDEATVRP